MIYLILDSILFGISLLAVFPAPTNLLWKLAVGVTEFPYLFMLLSFLCTFFPIHKPQQAAVGDLLCLFSFVLFVSPLIRSWMVSLSLSKEIRKIYPSHTLKGLPLSAIRMTTGMKIKKTSFQSINYKTIPGKDLKLDFYSAKGKNTAPCVLVVHGGAWDSGDSTQLNALNHYLSGKGYHVAAINYRLAPAYHYPAQDEDIRDAITFLKAESAQLGIDNRFVLLGRSAGGQLALTNAYTQPDPDVKGVVAFYAPADMVWGYSAPGNPLILDSRKVMENFLGGTYDQARENYHASSSLEAAGKDAPPTLLIHGKRDEMVAWEHSRRLHEKLNSLGVPSFLLTLPWATHGCDFNFSGPSGQLSTFCIEHFLGSILNHQEPSLSS